MPSSTYVTLQNKKWRGMVYNYGNMLEGLTGASCLVCLTDFQLMWLQSNLDYMRWITRWENISIDGVELNQLADDLELALMTCIDIQPYQIQFIYQQTVDVTLQFYVDAYDLGGIPELNSNTPTDFYSGDGSDDRLDALCSACNIYVRSYAQNWVSVAQTTLGLVFAIGLLASISIVGGIIATVLVGGLAFITQVAIDAMQDETALDNVVCCMLNSLDGLAVTEANFQTSLDGCGFGVGSNEAIIRDIIVSDLDQFKNWLSFLNSLGDTYVLAQIGVSSCPCAGWAQRYLDGHGNPEDGDWVYAFGEYNGVTLESDWEATGSSATISVIFTFTGPTTVTKAVMTGRIFQESAVRDQVIQIRDDLGAVVVEERVEIDSIPNSQTFEIILEGISQAVDTDWTIRFNNGATRTVGFPTGTVYVETMLIEGTGTDPF